MSYATEKEKVKSERMSGSASPDTFSGCGKIYETFSKCMSPGYQIQHIHKFAETKDCTIIFADWRTCLQVQITSDPVKKEVNEKLY